ncbi:MAG: T9SS type A sorting domain-containing protein [Bacteroidales bacterium]|nr:T9SS type A sorting domain-containing protein [Bacteroidales bacterium]
MKNSAKVLLALLILNFGIFTILIAQNNCLDFDGTDDYVNCGNDGSLNIISYDITLEAWINPVLYGTGTDHNGANWTPVNGSVISGNHYNIGTFTITAGYTVYITAYSGGSNGWLEVHANTININGTLNGNSRGYPGGAGAPAIPYTGNPGSPGTGDGGSTNIADGAGQGINYRGGGGGGYGGVGGDGGGYSGGGAGGYSYGTSSTYDKKIGAGGAGGGNWEGFGCGGNGGTGGSLILLDANTINISNTISVNGTDGSDGVWDECKATSGGGGGAGGTIIINAGTLSGSGNLYAQGGDGGKGGDKLIEGECPEDIGGDGGGGGAGGRIKIWYNSSTFSGSNYQTGGSGGTGGNGLGYNGFPGLDGNPGTYNSTTSRHLRAIIGKDRASYCLMLSDNADIIGYINNTTVSCNITTNEWQHIAFVYNGVNEIIYVNGIEKSSIAKTGNIITSAENFQMSDDTEAFKGLIDEVRIWNDARTQTEIRDWMYKTEGLNNEGNLVSVWHLNESSVGPNSAIDSKGSNNGTPTNMTNDDCVTSTAPIPYYTAQDGNWNINATWASGQNAPTNDWANVSIGHTVTVNSNEGAEDVTITSSGAMTINTGNILNVTGDFIIESDATGTGSLIHNTAGVNATVEQYLTSERWHLVSPPISDATINVYFDIYLKEWNEPDSTWTYLVNPTTSPMNETQGYAAWSSDIYTGTTTVSYSGALNTGDKIPTISYTVSATHAGKGWNLIGNPYPCALDWNTNWSITDLSGWAVVYDNGTYRGWHTDGTSYNGKPNGIIPSTQGFWIRALNTSASLTIPASERVHNSQVFYKEGQETIYPEVRIKAESNGYTDEAVVIFHPECTAGFDGYYDLSKFWNIKEAPQLYSITEEEYYAVNFLHENYHEVVIPIGFKAGQPGIFIITATSIANFSEDINIYLEDKKNGDFVKLYKNTQYEFGYNPEENDHRFNLHFTEINYGIEDNIQSVFNIYSYNDVVYIQNPENIRGDIFIYNLMGQEVANAPINSALNKITLNKSGNYVVKVLSEKSVVTRKVFIK